MSTRVVTSLPPVLAGFVRAEASERAITLDQVVGAAYRDHAGRLRDGWRPEGMAPAVAVDNPFARPMRAHPRAGGAVQVTFRGFTGAALDALDLLARDLGCVREGDRPNRSSVIALLLAAAADGDQPTTN